MIQSADIAVRGYVIQNKPRFFWQGEQRASERSSDIVAVIDTETTVDTCLNLKFGSFGVWVGGKLHQFIIFYSEKITKKEQAVLRNRVRNLAVGNVSVEMLPLSRFISEVFYPVVYDARALLVGFNLPFDITRLACRYGLSRRWKAGFTFFLTENRFWPQVRIMTINAHAAFIEFARPPNRNQRHARTWYKGHFLDLHTLGFALANKNLSLKEACRLFQTETQKRVAKEHGTITTGYVDYNINDVQATYSLYQKMIEHYDSFHIDLPAERVYSPATIGKQYLRQMGVKPFPEQNPNFPQELLGKIMTTYFGGRSEVRIRKKPMKVRYMDFTSMYPSVFSLMNLWSYVTADKIEAIDATDQTRRLVNNASLENLRNPALWKGMITIVQVYPDEDILPTRAHYGEKLAFNIGLPYLTSSRPLWYTLSEVLGGKLLTSKPPRILRAIKFVPQGVQPGLKSIKIVGDSTVNPDEDLFLKLRQLRARVKKQAEQEPKDTDRRDQLESVQKQLKIIANSTSYGIFMQVVTGDQKCEVEVYGLDHFKCEAAKRESFGDFFNPIIATMLTSGARLLLAMAEAWLEQHGGYYTFCDTDSMAVIPFHWKWLQEYFEPLNPLPEEPGFLKLEKENYDEHGRLRGLWFYGISAKRYVLYVLDEQGEPVPVKWSSHGIGQWRHGENADWEKQLWTNILRYEYGKISKQQLLGKYGDEYAVSKLQITSPSLMRRVKAINKGKPYEQQIKPFNFMSVGSPTMTSRKGPIIPLTNFTSPELAPFQQFIDAKTGQLYEDATQLYWKTLDKTVEEYMGHPESKFQNGCSIGKMRRRHLSVDSILHIGKEHDELQETEVLGLDDEAYVQYLKRNRS